MLGAGLGYCHRPGRALRQRQLRCSPLVGGVIRIKPYMVSLVLQAVAIIMRGLKLSASFCCNDIMGAYKLLFSYCQTPLLPLREIISVSGRCLAKFEWRWESLLVRPCIDTS